MTQDLGTAAAQVRRHVDDAPHYPFPGDLSPEDWLVAVAEYQLRIDAMTDAIASELGGRIRRCSSGKTTVHIAGISSSSTAGTTEALRNWLAAVATRMERDAA